jgi:hypothetical protein
LPELHDFLVVAHLAAFLCLVGWAYYKRLRCDCRS